MNNDPYWSNVVLLIPGRGLGLAGPAIVEDYAPNSRGLLNWSNVFTATDQFKHYGSALQFNGTDPNFLYSCNDLNFGTGNFTIELWWKYKSGSQPYGGLLSCGNGGYSPNACCIFMSDERFWLGQYGNPDFGMIYHGKPAAPKHLAWSRSGETLRLFIDGTIITEANYPHSLNFSYGGHTRIGRNGWDNNGNANFAGYLNDIRVTKGVARYTAPFTPPGPFLRVEDYSRRWKGILTDNAGWRTVNGRAAKPNGEPADSVVVRDWATKMLIATATPDSQGDWSLKLPPGEYDITYLAAWCAPICHGPYAVMGV